YIVSESINLPKVKDLYFKDFPGAVKSLGAWGGDFVMVCSDSSENEIKEYFFSKGFKVVIPYNELLMS
ncbi:MAG: GHMP kinase, partial [Bacteroidota bacterium]